MPVGEHSILGLWVLALGSHKTVIYAYADTSYDDTFVGLSSILNLQA